MHGSVLEKYFSNQWMHYPYVCVCYVYPGMLCNLIQGRPHPCALRCLELAPSLPRMTLTRICSWRIGEPIHSFQMNRLETTRCFGCRMPVLIQELWANADVFMAGASPVHKSIGDTRMHSVPVKGGHNHKNHGTHTLPDERAECVPRLG